MRIKKILIDRASRLHQTPPDILSSVQSGRQTTLIRKPETINLGSINWPVMLAGELAISREKLTPAGPADELRLKDAIAEWIESRHGLKLNSAREIYLGGSGAQIFITLAMAFLDPGDIAFVPDLGDPMYRRAVIACSAEPVGYAVARKEDWFPRFDRLNGRLGSVARLLILNSPHNPTGARLSERQLSELAWLAARENILVVNDASFQSLPTNPPASLLSIEGGKRIGVEVYSLSYLLGLPDLPFGFVVGNREVVAGLEAASRILPSYLPLLYVDLAIEALRKYPGESLVAVRKQIQQAAIEITPFMEALGLENEGQSDLPFLWAGIKGRRSSLAIARLLYRRGRVLAAPGEAFGNGGAGYLRLSLTAEAASYKEAAKRVKGRLKLLTREKSREG